MVRFLFPAGAPLRSNRNFLYCPDAVMSMADQEQRISPLPIMRNTSRCFIFDVQHTRFPTCQISCACIILDSLVCACVCVRVCVCVCVRAHGASWQMMLFRCRAHRHICGQSGNVSFHANESPCRSYVITARNDTNQPFSPPTGTHPPPALTIRTLTHTGGGDSDKGGRIFFRNMV